MKIGKWIINKRNAGWLHPVFAVYKNEVKVGSVGWDWLGHIQTMDISVKYYGWFWRSYIHEDRD